MELSIRNLTQRCALLITVQKAAPLMLIAYMIVIKAHNIQNINCEVSYKHDHNGKLRRYI